MLPLVLLPLALVPACTRVGAPDDPAWEGIPLARGQRPDWAADLGLDEAVSTGADGHRFALRIVHPLLQMRGSGEVEAGTQDGLWTARYVPADGGPTQAWEIRLQGEPERLAGTTTHLSPSGGDLVAMTGPAEVKGVLDLGGHAYGVRCIGAEADLAPQGWCLSFLSRLWLETWEG